MNDDDDDWLDSEEPPVEPLVSVPGGHGVGIVEVSGMLLQLLAYTFQLKVLLEEAEEAEFKALLPRLRAFRTLVESLPDRPRPTKTIGFKGKQKAKR